MEELGDHQLRITKSCNISTGVVDLSAAQDENYIKGGILSNQKLSWVSCGSRITTINNDDGSKRTGWTFGWGFSDPSYKIVCVEELPMGSFASPILVVGCESELNGSCLCFYHSGSSRVLKAIHFNDKIAALGMVSKTDAREERLSGLLKFWNGIVAVGTNSGKVYLLDVWWKGLQKCIEDYHHSVYDEHKQSKLIEVTLRDLADNIECRTNSVRHGSSTLALWLNEETLQRQRSATHPGVQNILGRMPREFLAVSALRYFPQISTLAVGYNTSCFQLWDLSSLTILYTSALLEAMLPVFSFSLLEPSDDPRYVCYLWSLHHSIDEDNLPFAGMYLLNYREKHLSDYSMLPYYRGFSSCSIRYQLDLGIELDNVVSGRIISCQALHRSHTKSTPAWQQEEASSEEATASLLSIMWEVWVPNQLATFTQLTLFDLNQWYREYMPQSSDIEYSHFMAHFCLPDGPLLDVSVVQSSVRQFVTLQPVDEHFFPTATTFQCVCLQQTQVMTCDHHGTQEVCLQAIKDGGSSALLLPSRLYKLCTLAGIKPLLMDVSSPNSSHSKEQREYLLCVALEYGMMGFLRSCVHDWSDGSHAVAGCTLPNLLHWAWGRVDRYKKCLDGLCVPLFDYSGTALDSNDLGLFHHLICQLHDLQDLFHLVLDKYHNCIIQGNYEQQHTALSLVTAFYDSVLWCVRYNILPETNAGDTKGHIPYFTDIIVNSTISRRAELHQLGRSLKLTPPPTGLLLVDAVIMQEGAGDKLTDQWEREGGTTTMGKYPPSSVQSLLRSYLVRGIPIHVKHFIVSYFLYDVVHALQPHSLSEEMKTKLLSYCSEFGHSESQSKIATAFWCLDHCKFQEGVSLLLDDAVNKEDMQVYQHRTVICLLLASGHHKLALHYLNIRKPGLVEPQDIRMKMTLLLVNGLIHEAFEFQRHHSSYKSELIHQFFTGCVEMNKLEVVFKLPMNPAEENAFMSFLEKTSHPQSDDLRVLYLLSRSRYVEAIDMNEKMRGLGLSRRRLSSMPVGLSPRSRNLEAPTQTVLTTRDLLINSVAKSLPSVTRDLAEYCAKEKNLKWNQVARPAPLSVVVHTDLSAQRLPFYKAPDSLLVQAALSKTRETWTPAALKRKLCSTVEDTPFLRTPLLPRLSNLSPLQEGKPGVRWRADDTSEDGRAKRPRLELSPSTEQTTHKTESMDMTCPESCALLHTPLVSRLVKQPKEATTPHSILKGSATNTPVTPARSDKTLVASVVSRQIRFSLPSEEQSPSSSVTGSMVDGDDDDDDDEENLYSPTVSPRKSIHELSDVQKRKGTPANPRILRHSFTLRSSAAKLKFLDDDITNKEPLDIEPSATADTILKKISVSPGSSEETYFSFHSSSSSQKTKSIDSKVSFDLPFGLEGNIENEDKTVKQQENVLTGGKELNVSLLTEVEELNNVLVRSVEDADNKVPNYIKNTEVSSKTKLSEELCGVDIQEDKIQTQMPVEESVSNEILEIPHESVQPKSPEEIKIVIETIGTSKYFNKTKVVDYDTTEESFHEAESSKEDICITDEGNESHYADDKSPVYKWTKIQDQTQEALELEVSKQDDKGVQKRVAKVTVSKAIPMFYSESVETTKFLNKIPSISKLELSRANSMITTNENLSLDKTETESDAHLLEMDVCEHTSLKEVNVAESLVSNMTSRIISKTENEQLEESKLLTEENNKNKMTNSRPEAVQPTSPIDKSQLPQILEEILNRGRISVSLTEKQHLSTQSVSVINNKVEKEAYVASTVDKISKCNFISKVLDEEKKNTEMDPFKNNNLHNIKSFTDTPGRLEYNTLEDSGETVRAVEGDIQSSEKNKMDIDQMKSDNTLKLVENELDEFEMSLCLESSIQDDAVSAVPDCSIPEVQVESELNSQGNLQKEQERELTFVTDSLKSITSQDQRSETILVTNLAKSTVDEENRSIFITDPKETDNVNDYEGELTVDTDITKSSIVDEPNKKITFVIDSIKTKKSKKEKEELSVLADSATSTTNEEQKELTFVIDSVKSITPKELKGLTFIDESESLEKKHKSSTIESVQSSVQEERETCSFSESTKTVASEEQKEISTIISSSAELPLFTTNKKDSIADIDFKMTEDDESFIEKDKTYMETEEAAEPLYENLKPVPFNVEENIEEEVTNQYNEELGEGDVEDIYGDIVEDKEDSSPDEAKKSESEGESGEDNDSDVICLGSSSDEELQKKSPNLSTSHRKVPDFSKRSLQVDETLDFEDETNDLNDDEDCNDEDSYHESSEGNYDSSENEIRDHNTEMSYSDSSEEDNHQGNRSWKSQRKDFDSEASSEKEDIASDENTIESPPYELIGQDSQSNSNFKTLEENVKSDDNECIKQPIDHGYSALNQIEINKSADQTKAEMSCSEDLKVVSSDIDKKIIPEQAEFILSESVHKETFEPKINETYNMRKSEKSKCHVETGSILDLKLRRSKRYSSATNLCSTKSTKLRRRSSSVHDITSLIISETKSAAAQLSDVESSTSISSSETDRILSLQLKSDEPKLCEDNLNLPMKRGRRSRLSQLQDITEENSENVSKCISPNDKTLRRSVSSNQLVEQQPVMGTSMKRSSSSSILSEYGKASGLELGTNISKETHTGTMSSSHESSKIKLKKRWTLEMEAMNYITRKKRKSSVASSSLEVINSSDEEESEKDKSRMPTKPSLESGPNNTSTVIVERNDENKHEEDIESSVTMNTEDVKAYDCELEVDTIPRLRSQSVPPTLQHFDPPRLSTKRRSSSLMKIENIHRKVLKRYSHKKKSLQKSTYEPLEIVHSDEESIKETIQENIKDCSKKLIVPEENIEDKNNSINEIETSNIECFSQDTSTTKSLPLASSRRNLRSSSEPPSYEDVGIPKRQTNRRSSSACKINKIHKLILSRHSLRKSVYSNNFQPMEVVQSDDEQSFYTKDLGTLDLEPINEVEAGKKVDSTDKNHQDGSKRVNFDEDNSKTTNSKILHLDPLMTDNSGTALEAIPSTSNERHGEETPIICNIVKQKIKLPKEQKVQLENNKIENNNFTSDAGEDNKTSVNNIESDIEQMVTPHVIKKRGQRKKEKKASNKVVPNSNILISEIISDNDIKKTRIYKSKKGKNKKGNTNIEDNSRDTDSGEKSPEDPMRQTDEDELNVPVKRRNLRNPSTNIELATPKKAKKVHSSKKENSKDIPSSKVSEIASKQDSPPIIANKIPVEHEVFLLDSPARRTRRSMSRAMDIEVKTPTKEKVLQEHELFLLDTPAKRTRRSMSRASDTELLTPTIEKELLESKRRTRRSISRASDTELLTPTIEKESVESGRKTRRSGAMSDIVLSTPSKHVYAESEASDTSTSSRLNTPRRSTRRQSITAASNTPGDMLPEEYLTQRRLTRNQHSQLQKSFELSMSETPRLSRLEDLPEEDSEGDTPEIFTPVRSSARNKRSHK